MVQRLGHYDGMSKNDWKHLRCHMEKDGACKMDKIKKCSWARKSGRRKNIAGAGKEEEKILAGSLAMKGLSAEGCSRRNGNRKESSQQKKISDDRQHYDKWSICRKAEKRVEWRMLSLQWKICSWAERYGWLIEYSPTFQLNRPIKILFFGSYYRCTYTGPG